LPLAPRDAEKGPIVGYAVGCAVGYAVGFFVGDPLGAAVGVRVKLAHMKIGLSEADIHAWVVTG
jgi:hypothetical protein